MGSPDDGGSFGVSHAGQRCTAEKFGCFCIQMFLDAPCQAVPAPSPRKKLPESIAMGFGQPPVIPAQRGMRAGGQRFSLRPPEGPDPAHTPGAARAQAPL